MASVYRYKATLGWGRDTPNMGTWKDTMLCIATERGEGQQSSMIYHKLANNGRSDMKYEYQAAGFLIHEPERRQM